jgi:hypothetical protein
MQRPRVKFSFAWYDLWVGFYVDRRYRRLYVCPLPCLLFTFWLEPRPSLADRLAFRVMDRLHDLTSRLDGQERDRALRDMADYAQALREACKARDQQAAKAGATP